MPDRYFFCDQSLTSFSGHSYTYFQPLQQVLQSRDKKVLLVGNKVLEKPVAELGVVPAFTYSCDQREVGEPLGLDSEANADAIRVAHEKAIIADLQRLHDQFRFRAGDKLIINSIHRWPMRGIVQWMEQLSDDECPKIALVLHFTSQPERLRYDSAIRHYQEAFEKLTASRCRDRLRLYADSAALVDEYREFTCLPVKLAPIPHCCLPADAPPNTRSDRRLHVGYLGEARFHKGFHLLPYVVNQLRQSELGDCIEFHIHSFIFDRAARFYQEAIAHLTRLPNVMLYPDIFDPVEYRAFLGSCDVILLPYLLTYYYRQSSGIFADAVGMGLPVIVSRGTWMAKELMRLGAGAIVEPDNQFSLAETTFRVCRDIEEYRRQASRARKIWCELHGPEKMIEMLESW